MQAEVPAPINPSEALACYHIAYGAQAHPRPNLALCAQFAQLPDTICPVYEQSIAHYAGAFETRSVTPRLLKLAGMNRFMIFCGEGATEQAIHFGQDVRPSRCTTESSWRQHNEITQGRLWRQRHSLTVSEPLPPRSRQCSSRWGRGARSDVLPQQQRNPDGSDRHGRDRGYPPIG